ncbi:MAG TPA: protein translocase subunit SecD, partial [Marivita sp.]|nr:protein translocase subunit SecD [Marivita sp.]
MLQIDLWKRLLIWTTVAVGLMLALPNTFYPRVEQHNDAVAAIEVQGETPELLEQASGWPSFLPS